MDFNAISQVASHFAFEGNLTEFKELTAGNVNMTYLLIYTSHGERKSYILQRINTGAFRDPVSLMNNIGKVTTFMRETLEAEGVDPARRVLSYVSADNGTLLYNHPTEGAWRAYHCVEGATAHDTIDSPALFYEAGKGFGEFQTRLADFPVAQLTETIPNFHNTAWRYGHFLQAIEEDAVGRVSQLTEEIAFFHSRKDLAHVIVSMLGSKDVPLRVTHNDTKLNNVLIDDETGKALCVIDLDTVMPGSALYDFGDAVRYGACTSAEDEPDTSKIGFDMTLFEAFTKGFVEATRGNLTECEIRMLPVSIAVITYELAMRFLTDYINGDVYFKTRYEGHNLVRAKAQMTLLLRIEERLCDMEAFVAGIVR